ncbi:MAG: spermidine/putrescine transport system permease protein [Actinomycetota bacterium]|jgi:spermidine/putrescine transport system permease protein|nr:spermidine/putrescine transport system permease protein [Actinomycetota bacterium]
MGRSAVGEPRWLIAPALIWILVFFVAPLMFMVAFSLGVNEGFFTVKFGVHLDQFKRLFDPIYLNIYKDTLVMAGTGTLLCLLIGFPFAYFLATRTSRHRNLLFLLVIVPFWTSLLIRTYSWVLILGEQGLLSDLLQGIGVTQKPIDILYTNQAVLVGVVYDYLPLMVFPLFVAIDRMDRSLIEASRDLGSGHWRTFRQVTVPLVLPGILTGCLLTFIPMMGEYVVPTILGGAKSFLVGSLVANEILTAIDWPFGAAVSMGLILVMLVTIFLYLRILGRRAREGLGSIF